MLFNSLAFALFFPLVTVLYFALPQRLRRAHLLAASCLFYMAYVPAYLLILLGLILIDYAAGLLLERARVDHRRRAGAILAGSLLANLGMLLVFKYLGPHLGLALPLGLSFHTFQSMSYTIEVYRGRQRAERSLSRYALYVIFYPQLVAGPIERPRHLLPQFDERHEPEPGRILDGLKLMAWGLFQKVVIADRLGILVDRVYDHPAQHRGLAFLLATVFFSFQLYGDFAGYSDMAAGAAQVMGFRLTRNFHHPYFARSVGEFWHRWHISLSSWLRDYVYLPLGGSRGGRLRHVRNILLVWLLSGMWHGAAWTFVAWGLWHGMYFVVSLLTQRPRARLVRLLGLARRPALHRALQVLGTFGLICLGRVFFRAASLPDAWYIGTHVFSGVVDVLLHLGRLGGGNLLGFRDLFQADFEPWLAAALILLLLTVWVLQERLGSLRQALSAQPVYVRWPVYQAVVLLCIFLAQYERRPFIYFQF